MQKQSVKGVNHYWLRKIRKGELLFLLNCLVPFFTLRKPWTNGLCSWFEPADLDADDYYTKLDKSFKTEKATPKLRLLCHMVMSCPRLVQGVTQEKNSEVSLRTVHTERCLSESQWLSTPPVLQSKQALSATGRRAEEQYCCMLSLSGWE